MSNSAQEERIRRFLEQPAPDEPSDAAEDKTKDEANSLAKKNYVARSIADKLEASLKPKGYFNISETLDERRLHYGIPNGVFDVFPSFDKIYVHQIPFSEREEYSEGGVIIMTDVSAAYERNMAPRGVLCAAGLQAMDALSSSGIEVGHIVRFRKMHPHVMPVECIDGTWMSVFVMRDGDITGSEDVAADFHSKRIQLKNVAEDKGEGPDFSYDWRFVNEDGVYKRRTGQKINAYDDRE